MPCSHAFAYLHSFPGVSTQKIFTHQDLSSQPGVVVHTYNPSTWEAKTGGSQVQNQPQQLSETLSNLARPCFKIKIIRAADVAQR